MSEFLEILESIITPASRISKRFGFIQQSIALGKRAERCQKQWHSHVANCQSTFKQIAQKLPHRSHVVILGSAQMTELPLDLVLQYFGKVTLVDVQHPLSIWKQKLKLGRKLQLINMDLSESLTQLTVARSAENFLDWYSQKELDWAPLKKTFKKNPDLVISANLISQLGLLPIDFFERTSKTKLPVPQKDQLCIAMAQKQIDRLSKLSPFVWIYSDREVIFKNTEDIEYQRSSYPLNFNDYQKHSDWLWNLAPLGEASRDYSIQMKIESYFKTATNNPS